MTSSPDTLKAAAQRLEAWCSIIDRPALDGDNSLAVDASVAAEHASDIREILTALNEPKGGETAEVVERLTQALAVWHEAFETGRSEPLFVARDHGSRAVADIVLGFSPLVPEAEPVAWRYAHVYPGRDLHWKVRQTPVRSSPATHGYVAVVAEPLYASPVRGPKVSRNTLGSVIYHALEAVGVHVESHQADAVADAISQLSDGGQDRG